MVQNLKLLQVACGSLFREAGIAAPASRCSYCILIRRRSDYIIGFVTPAIGPNKFKKLTRLIVPVHNTRGKVWMKNNIHGFTDNKLIVCEALCAVFHSNFAA